MEVTTVKNFNLFTMAGHLSAGVVRVSPMELAAGRKSARVRHAQPWSAERGLLNQLPTAYTGGGVPVGVTTTDNSIRIDAPSAHERSRT
jgi:hypothetical protein